LPKQKDYNCIEELLDEMEENSLLFGMTLDEFWDGNPQYFWVYGRDYAKKEKKKAQENLNFAWQIGMYNMLGVSQAISGITSKTKVEIFPKKPYNLYEKPLTEEEIAHNMKVRMDIQRHNAKINQMVNASKKK
jgi:hypothetical protein